MAGGKLKTGAAATALLVIAISAFWYFESPAWTLKGMKDAAQSHDADALNAYIDYPALRESLKGELMARMTADAEKDKSGFEALGMAVASAAISPMIDGLVSPAGMRAALMANGQQQNAHTAASALQVPKQPVLIRRNFSEFLVTTRGQPNSGLVFKRHGLSWMLSAVELPPADSSPRTAVPATEQQQLHQLDALNLAIALKRAVVDAGYACKRVSDAGFVGAWKNLEMWVAKCDVGNRQRNWAIFAGPDGSAQVRECRDIPASGLPDCVIKEHPGAQ